MKSSAEREARALAFLRMILPHEGYYVAAVVREGRRAPQDIPCASLEELARTLIYHDDLGHTVYHSCAGFVSNVRAGNKSVRRTDNACGTRALHLDVDCHPSSKRFSDASMAYQTIKEFVRRAGLPNPLCVGSGNGLHCYIPLRIDIDVRTFRTLAAGLKALCEQHELTERIDGKNVGVDPGKTADIVALLRTPGTHNRKNPNDIREVEYDGTIYDGYSIADLRAISAEQYVGPHRDFQKTFCEIRGDSARSRLLDVAVSALQPEYEPGYADAVADHCAHIAAFRRSGDMPETLWYARIGPVARCVDGPEKVHQWSKNGFARYDENETQQKIEQQLRLDGPTTCKRLAELDGALCHACQFWGKIGSPLALGARKHNGAASGQHNEIPARPEERIGTGLILPHGYAISDQNELIFKTEEKGGAPTQIKLTSFPFHLVSVQRAELDAQAHFYTFAHHLPHDGWQQFTIPAKDAVGPRMSSEFAGKGVVVHEPLYFSKFIKDSADAFSREKGKGMIYDQYGWKDDDTAFLLGNKLYRAGKAEIAPLAELPAKFAQYFVPHERSSLEHWTEAANTLFCPGLEAVSFGALCGPAAPLMRFAEQSEGGAVYHTWGDPGGGKTMGARGAWTFWGHKHGTELFSHDTQVAKPRKMGLLCNLPVIHDENAEKDPAAAEKFISIFTSGRDRERATTEGSLRADKAEWNTIFVSCSNENLTEKLTGLGHGLDQMAWRTWSSEAKLVKKDPTTGEKLKRILEANQGQAGIWYTLYLTRPEVLAWTKDKLAEQLEELWLPEWREHTALRFRIRLLACVLVAAMLVDRLDLMNFSIERLREWGLREIDASLKSTTLSPLAQAHELLSTYIQEFYMSHALRVTEAWSPHSRKNGLIVDRTPILGCFMRHEMKPNRLFLDAEHFRKWVVHTRGASFAKLIAQLREKEIVRDIRMITFGAGTNIPAGQKRAVEIDTAHPVMSGMLCNVAEHKERAAE